MAVADVELHRWTREEYERLAAGGFFPPETRLELVDGLIYQMTPQSSFHSTAVQAAQEMLRRAFPAGFVVRVQMPLALGEDSEPEPAVAVVSGELADYSFSHPTTAALIVEVADSSLLHDRRRKIPLYAWAEVPEVWLLVLRRRVLEVYRHPAGGSYRSKVVLHLGEAVSPILRPDVSIPVGGLLPWLVSRPSL